jgi:hypothetical protein
MKKIICPVCKAEYTVQEIFIPKYFFGTIDNVEKDISGKIIDYTGKDMDLNETYRCDYCNSKFNIYANISFKCESKVNDFSKKYSTKLNKPQLKFKED